MESVGVAVDVGMEFVGVAVDVGMEFVGVAVDVGIGVGIELESGFSHNIKIAAIAIQII
jgi:hypothetical protein